MPRITAKRGGISSSLKRASMRPGRNAPDNHPKFASEPLTSESFNEAGAKCPG